MKIPHLSLLVLPALFIFSAGPAYPQATAAATYSEAQRSYLAGNLDVAKEKFLAVLSVDPENLGAKNYLKSIAIAEKKNKKSTLSSQLSTLIVPKVSFKEASFDSVLTYLKAKASEISGDKVNPSFVLQTPPNFAKETPITLELTNVPFTEVMRYLGELTATQFEIQEYAIVIKPKA